MQTPFSEKKFKERKQTKKQKEIWHQAYFRHNQTETQFQVSRDMRQKNRHLGHLLKVIGAI